MPQTPNSHTMTVDQLPWGLEFRSVHCASQFHHSYTFEATSDGLDRDNPLDGMNTDEELRFLEWWEQHHDCEPVGMVLEGSL